MEVPAMAERVFADPYEYVRGTSKEPCSPQDRAVALAMSSGSGRFTSASVVPGRHGGRPSS